MRFLGKVPEDWGVIWGDWQGRGGLTCMFSLSVHEF